MAMPQRPRSPPPTNIDMAGSPAALVTIPDHGHTLTVDPGYDLTGHVPQSSLND